jgi:hypothetical protein
MKLQTKLLAAVTGGRLAAMRRPEEKKPVCSARNARRRDRR